MNLIAVPKTLSFQSNVVSYLSRMAWGWPHKVSQGARKARPGDNPKKAT